MATPYITWNKAANENAPLVSDILEILSNPVEDRISFYPPTEPVEGTCYVFRKGYGSKFYWRYDQYQWRNNGRHSLKGMDVTKTSFKALNKEFPDGDKRFTKCEYECSSLDYVCVIYDGDSRFGETAEIGNTRITLKTFRRKAPIVDHDFNGSAKEPALRSCNPPDDIFKQNHAVLPAISIQEGPNVVKSPNKHPHKWDHKGYAVKVAAPKLDQPTSSNSRNDMDAVKKIRLDSEAHPDAVGPVPRGMKANDQLEQAVKNAYLYFSKFCCNPKQAVAATMKLTCTTVTKIVEPDKKKKEKDPDIQYIYI